MLKGRLGLETARVPQKDRHGMLWLSRGELAVRKGTLHFTTAGDQDLAAGDYDLPYQMINCIVLGPGSTVTHDALRLLARHGTGLVAAGVRGVRHYASMPFGPDSSTLARRQARLWASPERRVATARQLLTMRLGEDVQGASLNELRGVEGSRSRVLYKAYARQHGVPWRGRRFDRTKPGSDDDANSALNHASVAVRAAAQLATAVAGAIPQLGFVHEESGIAFCLDIADLYRERLVLDCAFAATARYQSQGGDLERITRTLVGGRLKEERVVAAMIDRIKEVLNADDPGGDE